MLITLIILEFYDFGVDKFIEKATCLCPDIPEEEALTLYPGTVDYIMNMISADPFVPSGDCPLYSGLASFEFTLPCMYMVLF